MSLKMFAGNNSNTQSEWPALGANTQNNNNRQIANPPPNGWAALSYGEQPNPTTAASWPALGATTPKTNAVNAGPSWAGVAGGGQQVVVPVGSGSTTMRSSGSSSPSWAGVAGQGTATRNTVRTTARSTARPRGSTTRVSLFLSR